MTRFFLCLLAIFIYSNEMFASQEYNELISNVRKESVFFADIPIAGGIAVNYEIELGESLFDALHISDFILNPSSDLFYRSFTDKILLGENSYIQVGDITLPATCLFVHGQDNRFSGKDTPLIPDFILRFTIVANDFSCTGPINPNWPKLSAKKETWESYIYFEVRDPTIMLPSEIKLRYRWNEYPMIKKEI